MKLSSLIQEDSLIFNLKASTKNEAILEIIQTFSPDKKKNQEIYDAVIERELIGSTLIENTGVVFPHVRSAALDDFYIGIGISEKGIETENNLGGMEKAFLFLVVAAHPLKNQLMLNIRSSLLKLLKTDPALFEKLKKPAGRDEFLSILSTLKTPQKLSLETVMEKNLQTISKEASLKEAVFKMVNEKISTLPVVNQENELLGEITPQDILFFSIPEYALRMDNFLFIGDDDPFEKYLMGESEIKVEEVMNQNPLSVKKDAPISEAVILMLKNGKKHIFVMDGKKITGMISQKDVLKKILFI